MEQELEKRVGKVENRLTAMEVKLEQTDQLTEKAITISDTLCKTLYDIQLTMKDISYQLQHTQQNTENIGKELQSYKSEVDKQFDKFKQDICNVGKEIKNLDEKSKIDFVLFLKANWFKIVTGVAVASLFLKDYII